MNPFDPDIFSAENPCVCCSGPVACACALLIPPFASPYSDYATASAVIADATKVSNCIGYFDNSIIPGFPTPASSTATDSGTAITLAQTFSSQVANTGAMWCSVSCSVGDTLAFSFTSDESPGPSFFQVLIYRCDGTLVEEILGEVGGIHTSAALPATDAYYIRTYILCGIV